MHLFPADLARRGPQARSADPCTAPLLSSGAAAGGVKSSTLVAQGNQMQVLAASGSIGAHVHNVKLETPSLYQITIKLKKLW